ncbi:MAG: CopD family protein [Proteobacteria bacterium]|nr:CopD family protein [Pseudomonadota bacterium]
MTGYLWLKAIHIIGVVCWFAGIFYLPRLFVYHSTATDQPSLERFKVMEDKLYRIIMRPAMIVSVVFGMPDLFRFLVRSIHSYTLNYYIMFIVD